ncbi:MAG TPA: hypothetical protein PLV62_08600, partial [Spirochaetota bacterium]|nr:hypothetical protein [Spirochaetota bacterium]
MKKILIVLLIINNIIIQYDSIIKSKEDLYEIKHINMEDKEGKISFIKNKVQTGEKYNFENGKTFLQYVIIGEWIIPPNKCINFYKNNIYKIRDFSTNFQEKGHWKLEGNKL